MEERREALGIWIENRPQIKKKKVTSNNSHRHTCIVLSALPLVPVLAERILAYTVWSTATTASRLLSVSSSGSAINTHKVDWLTSSCALRKCTRTSRVSSLFSAVLSMQTETAKTLSKKKEDVRRNGSRTKGEVVINFTRNGVGERARENKKQNNSGHRVRQVIDNKTSEDNRWEVVVDCRLLDSRLADCVICVRCVPYGERSFYCFAYPLQYVYTFIFYLFPWLILCLKQG